MRYEKRKEREEGERGKGEVVEEEEELKGSEGKGRIRGEERD